MLNTKNYSRENSAKDAFSLWENENPELVKSLNKKINDHKHKLIESIKERNINETIKNIDGLENSIINLHCEFEDWLFDYRKEKKMFGLAVKEKIDA